MSPTLIPAAALATIALVGVLGFRRLPTWVRIAFDAICFAGISVFLLDEGVIPIFPPLSAHAGSGALWLRTIGGAWWFLGARLVVAGLWFLVHRSGKTREARLFSELSAAAIYIATATVVLNSVFAIPVTSVVATSGIVAIVLGLALQNTLSDVFSGIAVGIEAPFGVGDRIQVGDRFEGQVVQVNWRSIRIRTDSDDLAIVPNSLVAKMEIVNRSFPSQRTAASVTLQCPETAIPETVIEILLQATLLCPAILRLPAPAVTLAHLGIRRNSYEIFFFVSATNQLAGTKDLLLRSARRQLHYAGLLNGMVGTERTGQPPAAAPSPARQLLRDLVLFECLSDAQIDALVGHLEPLGLEPDDVLFRAGQEDATLYVVASGILEFSHPSGAGPDIIGCIGAGDYVGEMGLLTGAPHAVTATAKTHCQIYQLPRDAIAPLLSDNAELASAFDKSARRGLAVLHRRVAVQATPDIGARGQLLLRIRNIFRFRADGGNEHHL